MIKRAFRKSAAAILALMLVLAGLSVTAFAAGSITVPADTLSLTLGETGQIVITASNAAGRIDWSSTGAAAASGSMWIENETKTISVYAGSIGTGSISVTLSDAATFDKTELSGVYLILVKVTAGRSVSNGMTGDDVLYVQNRLSELGYQVGDLDGNFGNMTESAVRAFQSDNGLDVDGIAGPKTLEKLSASKAQTPKQTQPQSQTQTQQRVLSNGMSGNDVYQLQATLAALGYTVGDLDGIFGSMTEAAVRAYQADKGLSVDGVAGPQTLGSLSGTGGSSSASGTKNSSSSGQTRTLRNGMTGNDVYQLQAALAALGYPVGELDSCFGSITEAAVYAFQKDHGLAVDGIAGPQTLGALGISGGSSASEPSSSSSSSGTGNVSFDRAMSIGMKGSDISALQTVLLQMGYSVGEVDGEFGDRTKAAVVSFQKDHALETDGIAGPLTQEALGLR